MNENVRVSLSPAFCPVLFNKLLNIRQEFKKINKFDFSELKLQIFYLFCVCLCFKGLYIFSTITGLLGVSHTRGSLCLQGQGDRCYFSGGEVYVIKNCCRIYLWFGMGVSDWTPVDRGFFTWLLIRSVVFST